MSLPVPVAPAKIVSANLRKSLESAAELAKASTATATRLAYQSDFADFCDWAERVAGAQAFPAEPETVAGYLAELHERGHKASTVARRLAAIRWTHRQAGQPNPTDHPAVRQVHKGIRRTIGVAPTQKAAATSKLVGKMLKHLPDTLKGKRDRALILVGFAGALRRSELVALNVEDITDQPGGIIVRLGKTKTDQEGKGQIRPIPHGSKLLPVAALKAWIEASGITEGPIFREVRKGGELRGRLTPQSVALVVKRLAKAAKLDPATFGGHSLRAGCLTSALETGADLFAAADLGGWKKLETVRGYDRRLKALKNHAGSRFL